MYHQSCGYQERRRHVVRLGRIYKKRHGTAFNGEHPYAMIATTITAATKTITSTAGRSDGAIEGACPQETRMSGMIPNVALMQGTSRAVEQNAWAATHASDDIDSRSGCPADQAAQTDVVTMFTLGGRCLLAFDPEKTRSALLRLDWGLGTPKTLALTVQQVRKMGSPLRYCRRMDCIKFLIL